VARKTWQYNARQARESLELIIQLSSVQKRTSQLITYANAVIPHLAVWSWLPPFISKINPFPLPLGLLAWLSVAVRTQDCNQTRQLTPLQPRSTHIIIHSLVTTPPHTEACSLSFAPYGTSIAHPARPPPRRPRNHVLSSHPFNLTFVVSRHV
jgi:hypothetical protein